MSGEVFLRGERIQLRTIERDDAAIDVLRRSRNDPDLREWTSFQHPNNREQVETFIEDVVESDETSTSLFVYVDGDTVGGVELYDVHSEHGTLGYWLLPEAQGHGYATEGVALVLDHAFDSLNLHHVIARTIDHNESSKAVLRRLGFTHEGSAREHVFQRGGYHDVEHYGILADEWDGSAAIRAAYS